MILPVNSYRFYTNVQLHHVGLSTSQHHRHQVH